MPLTNMAFVLVHVIFSVFLLFFGRLRHTTSTSAPGSCSWYTFHTNKQNCLSSNKHCQQNGGNLVTMETEEEYQFINKTIQSRNDRDNEWYIGLTNFAGEWKWISNHSLTIDKWQPKEPNDDEKACVVMAKNWPSGYYGLFKDERYDIGKMFICEYKTEAAKSIENATTNCIENNNDEKNRNVLSIKPTSNPRTTSHRTKEENTTSGLWKHTNISTIIDASTMSITSNSITKTSSQPSNMLVVIVLAVLLGVCICIFIIVFCWLRNKSRKWKTEKPESRKPSKTNTVKDAARYGQDTINNVNSEGVEITDAYSVLYVVPNDDTDYPRAPTHSKKRDKQEVVDICYAEVHDAVPPSCNKPTNCDEENEYMAPVDIAPTSNTRLHSAAVVTSTNDKDYQCLPCETTGPSSYSSLYATTDLNSCLHQVDPNITCITSTNDKDDQCRAHGTGQRSYSSLYATTDLNSKQNNCFERGSKVRKSEKENQASKRVKINNYQPSVDTIMSSSQQSQDTTLAPSSCEQKTEDTAIYAMVDLLDDHTEMHRVEDNVLYDKVEKSRKN